MRSAVTDKPESWCPPGVVPAEVVFFLFKIGEALLEPSVRLYMTEGVCRQMLAAHNESSAVKCSRLIHHPDQENDVQSTAAVYLMSRLAHHRLPHVLQARQLVS